MKMADRFKTLKGALEENKVSRYVLLVLAVANVLLAILAFGRDQMVVMVPPNLSEKVEISESQASSGLKESWATYVAMMMGNVTPRNAAYLSELVGKIVAPNIYKDFLESISEQTKLIEDEQLTLQFTPSQVFYLPEKDVVVVSGEFSLRGMRDVEKRMVRTYEIGIAIKNYRVQINSFAVYEGPWNPAREETEAKKSKKAKEEEDKLKKRDPGQI